MTFRIMLNGPTGSLWSCPKQWQSEKWIRLIGNQSVVRSLFAGASAADLEASWRSDLDAFIDRRARFLRYPDCSYFIPAAR